MKRLLALLALPLASALAPSAHAAVAPVRWCGNDVAATDRAPDRAGGPQVHVVYATPSDGKDRFASLASPLATDVAAIAAWWQREDPARAPRFDLFDFPACDSRFGRLDVSHVRLATRAAAFVSLDGRHNALADELSATPFGFAELDKKYLVFYDGPVDADDVCGSGSGSPRIGGSGSFAVVYLRSSCSASIGDGGGNALVAAHELLHALGALPRGAPHACADDDGHPCDSALDVLWPFYSLDVLDQALLDVGRDDYYAHSGGWFDIQDSAWLLDPRAQHALTIRVVGSGVVETVADGQGCRGVCVTEWNGGTAVQLAAQAAAGFRFTGWGGACAARREPSCLVELAAPAEVVATFRRVVRLSIGIRGRGVVQGAGIRCVRTCVAERLAGETLGLRVRAASGWRFVRWSGSCRGSRPACVVRASPSARVGALFVRR